MAERRATAEQQGPSPMLDDVRAGLFSLASGAQRELPPKYFYDHRGSQLFEAITQLPEYYLTRVERALLARYMPELVAQYHPAAVVELGAGSAEKTHIILDAMRTDQRELVYVPVDVSARFLDETAHRVRKDYPGLRVVPVVADMVEQPGLPEPVARTLPAPVWYVFLGSTIGNFTDAEATRLLARLRASVTPQDRLLLGADLLKDAGVIEAAYNDAQGITAAFNRNMLYVLNRELSANFDPHAFEHRAVFNEQDGRIEMHLIATYPQWITVPGLGSTPIGTGESIRTEISNKYDPARLTALLEAAGWGPEVWHTDDAGGYALIVAAPV